MASTTMSLTEGAAYSMPSTTKSAISAEPHPALIDYDIERTFLCLAGIGVTHSIAPAMHQYIFRSTGRPSWTFQNVECPTVEKMMEIFRARNFAGGVVTMPYKKSVIPFLDGIDDFAKKIGAVNNVYLTQEGQLRGTNTDWRGIEGCLLNASERGRGKPALIIGAGGASRAAVFALYVRLGCNTIYIINRDTGEVADLLSDACAHTEGSSDLKLVHITSVAQAKELATPFYVVGTVPDFEPQTASEIDMRQMLTEFLSREGQLEDGSAEKGVLLDMCFKPRNTRILKLGRGLDWKCVEGTEIIGHQIREQYRLWAGSEASERVPQEEAWRILKKSAIESSAINF